VLEVTMPAPSEQVTRGRVSRSIRKRRNSRTSPRYRRRVCACGDAAARPARWSLPDRRVYCRFPIPFRS